MPKFEVEAEFNVILGELLAEKCEEILEQKMKEAADRWKQKGWETLSLDMEPQLNIWTETRLEAMGIFKDVEANDQDEAGKMIEEFLDMLGGIEDINIASVRE